YARLDLPGACDHATAPAVGIWEGSSLGGHPVGCVFVRVYQLSILRCGSPAFHGHGDCPIRDGAAVKPSLAALLCGPGSQPERGRTPCRISVWLNVCICLCS